MKFLKERGAREQGGRGIADGWGLHSAQRDKVGPARGMREGDSKTRGRDQQRKEWEEQSLLGIGETPGVAGVE